MLKKLDQLLENLYVLAKDFEIFRRKGPPRLVGRKVKPTRAIHSLAAEAANIIADGGWSDVAEDYFRRELSKLEVAKYSMNEYINQFALEVAELLSNNNIEHSPIIFGKQIRELIRQKLAKRYMR